MMFINNNKQKKIVIIQKHNENQNIKKLNKFDIKQNNKSYENIKNIVLEKSKKQFSFFLSTEFNSLVRKKYFF